MVHMTLNTKRHTVFLFAFLFLISACSSASVQTDTPSVNNKRLVNTQSNNSQATNRVNLQFGLLSPLIGDWAIRDWQLQSNGQWQEQSGASWSFFAIHGNTAMRDEWQSNVTEAESLPSYTTHIRIFEPFSRTWKVSRISSRSREIEFFGGQENIGVVEFISQNKNSKRLTKSTFKNISTESFESEIAWSKDGGENWLLVYKLKATRQ